MAELQNIAVGVRSLPSGGDHRVRLAVHGAFVYLEAAEAAALATQLTDAAAEAMNADRAARRG
jgi:hypothetical protein